MTNILSADLPPALQPLLNVANTSQATRLPQLWNPKCSKSRVKVSDAQLDAGIWKSKKKKNLKPEMLLNSNIAGKAWGTSVPSGITKFHKNTHV